MEFPLVTTSWLEANLNNQRLVLIDVSMSKVVGKKAIEYDRPVFIPNSQHLDLERSLCDLTSTQVHAFPVEDQFTRQVQRLGINAESIVVFYDNQGVYSAPRAWWVFQAMGCKHSFVLDGGLPQWLSEKRAVVSGLSVDEPVPGQMNGKLQSDFICDSNYIMDKRAGGQLTLIDARSKERFLGLAPEPRAGVRSGHIPSALNLPFPEVLNGHCFKSPEQLSEIFLNLAGSNNTTLVFSCGSGITACITLLAAVVAGYSYSQLILYDGSWSDWGSNSVLPVER
ncbi:sulfurtransferase [Rheinheimera sp. 1928-s]|uniref:sulfurtransferase n=1 Tax=Rheinheimera sp. 1928-s TaxID=3033803 RepID=UPI002635E771|nr:sulfurtransferase [Rheinheimera sp. 1928-s]MDF3126488.1 sulfurtransferase [Rheinheimera sp. 1928-s]